MPHAETRSPSSNDDGALTRWERWVGHGGYVAEGVLYLLVGCFALLAAFGQRHPNAPDHSVESVVK
jgi:hypothetical protein